MGRGPLDTPVVAGHGALDVLGQVPPQVPSIGALDGLRCAVANGGRVGAGPVPTDDAHTGVRTQPCRHRIRVASGQDIERPAGDHVQQHGAIHLATAKGEVVDAEDRHRTGLRVGHRAEQVEQRVPTGRHAQPARQPLAGPPGQRHRDRRQRAAQWRAVSGVWRGQARYLLGERPACAGRHVADEPAHRQPDDHRRAGHWAVPQLALVAAVYPRSSGATAGTLGRDRSGLGLDDDPVRIPAYLLNGYVRQVPQEKIEIAPDSATEST
jgi:hypothetical protein